VPTVAQGDPAQVRQVDALVNLAGEVEGDLLTIQGEVAAGLA
jgi:hypothetical protein